MSENKLPDYEPDIDAYAMTQKEYDEAEVRAKEDAAGAIPPDVKLTTLYGRPVFIEEIDDE